MLPTGNNTSALAPAVSIHDFSQQHQYVYFSSQPGASDASPAWSWDGEDGSTSSPFPPLDTLVDPELEAAECNVSVDHLCILTPYQVVETEIHNKLAERARRNRQRQAQEDTASSDAGTGPVSRADRGQQAMGTADLAATTSTAATLTASLAVLSQQGNPPLACLVGVTRKKGTGMSSKGRGDHSSWKRRPSNLLRPFEKVAPHEVVIDVSVYIFDRKRRTSRMQSITLLGSHKLTDLRDHIHCLNDNIFEGPACKSGFFYIEGTFYNDYRDPHAIDYSENIIRFYSNRERTPLHAEAQVLPYKTATMADVTMSQLSVRPLAHYLYCHQGNCEHIVSFEDVRMLHPNDDQNRNAYPMRTMQSSVRRKKCRVCDIYPASLVTFDDRLAGENPCFFCDHCYRPLHYTLSGQLRHQDYSYEVFPFHQD